MANDSTPTKEIRLTKTVAPIAHKAKFIILFLKINIYFILAKKLKIFQSLNLKFC